LDLENEKFANLILSEDIKKKISSAGFKLLPFRLLLILKKSNRSIYKTGGINF